MDAALIYLKNNIRGVKFNYFKVRGGQRLITFLTLRLIGGYFCISASF